MEQLFKCKTIKQQKIMEWLTAQGVTKADIAHSELSGSAMVRVTNPAGQYMDLYCDETNAVRILNVTDTREEELSWYFMNETNEDESQEWREDLTEDEAAMVEQWDENYCAGFTKMVRDILYLESHQESFPEQDVEAIVLETM